MQHRVYRNLIGVAAMKDWSTKQNQNSDMWYQEEIWAQTMYKNRTLKTSAPWRAIQVQRCCELLRLKNEGICALMKDQIYQTSQLASQMCDDEMVSTCKNLNNLNTWLEQKHSGFTQSVMTAACAKQNNPQNNQKACETTKILTFSIFLTTLHFKWWSCFVNVSKN